jgi:hypothetical protein
LALPKPVVTDREFHAEVKIEVYYRLVVKLTEYKSQFVIGPVHFQPHPLTLAAPFILEGGFDVVARLVLRHQSSPRWSSICALFPNHTVRAIYASRSRIASFGACTRSCLVPRYRSVVWTEAWPSIN